MGGFELLRQTQEHFEKVSERKDKVTSLRQGYQEWDEVSRLNTIGKEVSPDRKCE